MLKDAVAILDIGSSKVVALIGERAVNNNFTIRAVSESSHYAYYNGEMEDEVGLQKAITEALDTVCSSAKVDIAELFVGIPGEFIKIKNKQHQILLNKRRKVKQSDVDDLYNGAFDGVKEDGWELIDRGAVYCFVDGNQRVAEPVGMVSESLSGYLTSFYCKTNILNSLKTILSAKKIKTVHYVPSPQAESQFLFSLEERYAFAVLVDVGYVSTSFSIILGNGLLYQSFLPIGGCHISGYLAKNLKVDFSLADKLKRKINLSLNNSVGGNYEVFVGDEQYSFDVSASNDIVGGVIDDLAQAIDKEIIKSQVKLPQANLAVSVTGGGLAFIRGGKERLASALEMPVNVVSPNVPFMNKPDESSKLSLLDYSLRLKKKK